MLGMSIGKNALVLSIFAIVTAGLLAFIYSKTADKIAEQEKRAAEKALLDIVPRALHDNDMLSTRIVLSEAQASALGVDVGAVAYLATQAAEPVAVIIPSTAPDGYSGDIRMLVGVFTDGRIAGVRVLSHKETPGLGDKIDLNKSDWILGFDGLSLAKPLPQQWAVKKDGGDFDQFTGATITPRAAIKRIKNTLAFFEKNKSAWLNSTNTKGTRAEISDE